MTAHVSQRVLLHSAVLGGAAAVLAASTSSTSTLPASQRSVSATTATRTTTPESSTTTPRATTPLDRVDLTGKRLLPFVTYAVSGLGDTHRDYARLASGATILDGLAVRSEQVADARSDIQRWLRAAGLPTA